MPPFGWIDDPAANAAMHRAMGMRPLYAAAPHLMADPIPADILLYKAWKDVLGAYPRYPAQKIGDCESFGNGHGHDLLQCVEAATEGVEYEETCTEALYGAGREKAGMLNSWGDGCYGGAMVAAMAEIGLVPRKAVGPYDGNRAKQWGYSGIPADVRELAGKVKLGGSALVTTVDEAIAALAAGKPVPVSSNQGFQGRNGFNRDAQGICEAGGSWPHCMCIVGRISSDGVDTLVIAQSWGDQGMPGGPCPFDLPDFCFRARRPVVERMLAGRDSYALSSTPGFARKPLPSKWTYAGFA